MTFTAPFHLFNIYLPWTWQEVLTNSLFKQKSPGNCYEWLIKSFTLWGKKQSHLICHSFPPSPPCQILTCRNLNQVLNALKNFQGKLLGGIYSNQKSHEFSCSIHFFCKFQQNLCLFQRPFLHSKQIPPDQKCSHSSLIIWLHNKSTWKPFWGKSDPF